MPITGTVTSFAVNSGSATGTVELGCYARRAAGQFTAVASSPTETLAGGPQSFSVSPPLEVQDGDPGGRQLQQRAAVRHDNEHRHDVVLQPGDRQRRDGTPTNQQAGYRLLVSATLLPNPPTTTITTRTTTTTIPRAAAGAQSRHPDAQDVAPGDEAGDDPRPTKTAARRDDIRVHSRPAAQVSFAFTQLFPAARSRASAWRRPATTSMRASARGTGARGRCRSPRAGSDKVTFDGRVSRSTKLKTGNYKVAIQATPPAGGRTR